MVVKQLNKDKDKISISIELPSGGKIKLEGYSKQVTESTLTIAQKLLAIPVSNSSISTNTDELQVPSVNSGLKSFLVGDEEIIDLDAVTKIDRLRLFIRAKLPHGWFNSKEVLELYQDAVESASFSTISTYLKRLTETGILIRKGTKRNIEYRLNPEYLDIIPEYQIKKDTRKLVIDSELQQ